VLVLVVWVVAVGVVMVCVLLDDVADVSAVVMDKIIAVAVVWVSLGFVRVVAEMVVVVVMIVASTNAMLASITIDSAIAATFTCIDIAMSVIEPLSTVAFVIKFCNVSDTSTRLSSEPAASMVVKMASESTTSTVSGRAPVVASRR
jgi:hypothetical protein